MVNQKHKNFSHEDPETWPPLLTVSQVATVLNISPWTLRTWDTKKKLVALRIGTRRDRRYKKADVIRILNEGLS